MSRNGAGNIGNGKMRKNPLSDPLFHVVLAWGIIFMICLASPVKAKTWPTHDAWGNPFPKECQRDLSNILVHMRFEDLGYMGGKKTLGYFLPSKQGPRSAPGTILVDTSIKDFKTQDAVIQHEMCHAVMWYETGNWEWHK